MTIQGWRIKHKLLLGVVLLVLPILLLAYSGIRGVYAYRQLVRQIAQRADEFPALTNLTNSLGSLSDSLTPLIRMEEQYYLSATDGFANLYVADFKVGLINVGQYVDTYQALLGENTNGDSEEGISDRRQERSIVDQIQTQLIALSAQYDQVDHLDSSEAQRIVAELTDIEALALQLPGLMQHRMTSLHGRVRGTYRVMIVTAWVSLLIASLMLTTFAFLFHRWVFRPIRTLLAGSRRVAAGEFRHRIVLDSNDEMAELAGAMNAMTTRFQEIRDDLDEEVRLRTREVVQSEQLASVGFLAAGVAHEINNPLAAIAMSAESLENRVETLVQPEALDEDDHAAWTIVQKYLRRIQEESFRCKGITERLLDFSRLGDVEPESTNLRNLTIDIIDMLQEIGRYRGKTIEFQCDQHVTAWVNPQEIKQVMLNLVTNALDSLEPTGGIVRVSLRSDADNAFIAVTDNGCGMTEEVREHLFEPFFTRRRDGSGTGLGLSITYRIVTDHGGRIEAYSAGPGSGSTLRVTLPVRSTHEQEEKQKQAA